jgi:hypothetical protein
MSRALRPPNLLVAALAKDEYAAPAQRFLGEKAAALPRARLDPS